MTEAEIPDYNIFMMCPALNPAALSRLPSGYQIRTCRPNELELWKAFPFDAEVTPPEYQSFMDEFVQGTYGHDMETFFQNTLFACTSDDMPVATCSHWKAYGKFHAIHWLKTRKDHEGKGLGRALLSAIMLRFRSEDYPIYIHTQPGSFRAIKLYADFGFKLLAGHAMLGTRTNDLEQSLPILQGFIPAAAFNNIEIGDTPQALIDMLAGETTIQF